MLNTGNATQKLSLIESTGNSQGAGFPALAAFFFASNPSAQASPSEPSEEKRHARLVLIINIGRATLNPVLAGAKDAVPQTSLLAIVAARLPPLAVVQVMVLDNKLSVKHAQKDSQHIRRRGVKTQATVASQLRKHNVLVADPPLVKAHGHAHELHRKVRQQRDAGNVENLLLRVGIQRQQRVRVLGEVVGAVKLPQAADLVHQAVVPVEPEVEDDAVEPGLERHPPPAHVGGGLGGAVGEEDGEDGAEGGRRDERAHHLPDADVGDAVALVGVAVEEAVPVAHGAEHVDLADGDELEGDAVEEEGLEGREVDARVLDVEVVQDEGDRCVEDDPAVHQPVGQVGDFF